MLLPFVPFSISPTLLPLLRRYKFIHRAPGSALPARPLPSLCCLSPPLCAMLPYRAERALRAYLASVSGHLLPRPVCHPYTLETIDWRDRLVATELLYLQQSGATGDSS